MKIPSLLFAGCVSMCPISLWADGLDPGDPLPVVEPLLDPEVKIAVMPTEVSLDGIDHPVLGRSLSDSLIGGLVAQGRAKVISYVDGKKEVVPPQRADAAPEALAGMLGRRLGAHRVLVPRLVGEDDFYRFTVKEVDAGNYEVIRVFELSHAGGRDGIFGFVPLVLNEFEKEAELEGRREGPGGEASIRIWSWEEFRRDFGGGNEGKISEWPPRATAVEGEPMVAKVESEVETGEEREEVKVGVPELREDARSRGRAVAEMVALGKVDSVNAKWGFCVIDMTGRKLGAGEEVEIREGESELVYATLVVTRVEGDKAIADLREKGSGKTLFPGDVVFGWAATAK